MVCFLKQLICGRKQFNALKTIINYYFIEVPMVFLAHASVVKEQIISILNLVSPELY